MSTENVGNPWRDRERAANVSPQKPRRERPRARRYKETMDEEVFNMSVRRFLKKLGVTAQREIELAVREQLDAGELEGERTLAARATVSVEGLPNEIVVDGEIELA
jgi:hypothetical protein